MRVRYWIIGGIALVAVSLLFTLSSEARIDPATIAGMWLFDDNDKDITRDSSGNGNDGTLVNDPKRVPGKFGQALKFDGVSTYVDCGNGPSLDIREALTVVAWVQFDAVDYKKSTGGLFTIAAKGYPDALVPHAGWWFSFDNRNNRQNFNYTCFGNKKGGWAGGGNNFGNLNFQFNKDEWYHVAITVGDATGKLYINGTPLGPEKQFVNLALSDLSRNLTIGSAGTSWYFSGIIDEFAIFNVALEEQDIQAIMEQGLEKATGLAPVDASGKLATTWAGVKAQ